MAAVKVDDCEEVTLYNKSHQTLSLQLSEIGADFYKQQQAHLMPSKTVTLPTKYLNRNQVNNLQARGMLKIVASK